MDARVVIEPPQRHDDERAFIILSKCSEGLELVCRFLSRFPDFLFATHKSHAFLSDLLRLGHS